MNPDDPAVQKLREAAEAALAHAYCRYSKFPVAAAVLSAEGEIFAGCNVENSSYGLTICAERAAVFNAIAAGQRQFQLLAIAAAGGGTPCGACRQVLSEFAPDLPILLVDVDRSNDVVEVNLRDLLTVASRPFRRRQNGVEGRHFAAYHKTDQPHGSGSWTSARS